MSIQTKPLSISELQQEITTFMTTISADTSKAVIQNFAVKVTECLLLLAITLSMFFKQHCQIYDCFLFQYHQQSKTMILIASKFPADCLCMVKLLLFYPFKFLR